jgi:uncharacterized repeat protein (TIGR01451 family)
MPPARLLEQGQVVYYTLRITNQSTVPLRNVAVVQPVPANTTYWRTPLRGPAPRCRSRWTGARPLGLLRC